MQCNKKHTPYQPTKEEWKCPKCGSEDFFIDNDYSDDDTDCELLHNNDSLICEYCFFSSTGKQFSDKLIKLNNLIICPTCKGKGHIPK